MSMPSQKSTSRRVPQQARGASCMARLLDAAAARFAEDGYGAATMTAIAERAGASIGSVYQYFPNKEALCIALRDRYDTEMRSHTLDMAAVTAGLPASALASHLIDRMTEFLESHPAYFAVTDAPVAYKRNHEGRRALRERLVLVFCERNPALSQREALRLTNVSLEILKSMNVLYTEANMEERGQIAAEYRTILSAYFRARLEPLAERL